MIISSGLSRMGIAISLYPINKTPKKMQETILTSDGKNAVCSYCVLEIMRRRGSDFVKKIGELWWTADQLNKQKVLNAWPEYFQQYADDVAAEGKNCRHA